MIQNKLNCYEKDGKSVKCTVDMPEVFKVKVRPDILQFAHSCIARNGRQPYAVSPHAGMKHSAHSWGTGRALARVPRVSGGGTRRAGQGAFANFCRKGRMSMPTKTVRKWNKSVNITLRRHAAAMAVAATASPQLVESRGHLCSHLEQIPLIVTDEIQGISKTKEALEIIENFGLGGEIERVKKSKTLRAGRGKMRNRRHVMRKGLLVVYHKDEGLTRAFRGITGVDFMQVDTLDLLRLAPGSHPGRLVMWTESAFRRLGDLFGTFGKGTEFKRGYKLMRAMMTCPDFKKVLLSEEVRAVCDKQPAKELPKTVKSPEEILALNPYLHPVSA